MLICITDSGHGVFSSIPADHAGFLDHQVDFPQFLIYFKILVRQTFGWKEEPDLKLNNMSYTHKLTCDDNVNLLVMQA